MAYVEGDSHMETWAGEQETASDRAWLRFCKAVDKLAGRDIDGDEGDGLALDGMLDAWKAGLTPAEYFADPLEWASWR